MKTALIALLAALAACSASPDRRQMVQVGYMERDCSRVRNDEEIPSMPIGLTKTPVDAAKALPNGCSTKFFMTVYADTENYYFLDNTPTLFSFASRSAERVKACSFVVDGHSGDLIRPPTQNWSGVPYVAPVATETRREQPDVEREDLLLYRCDLPPSDSNPAIYSGFYEAEFESSAFKLSNAACEVWLTGDVCPIFGKGKCIKGAEVKAYVTVEGVLSEPGHFGHFGMWERELRVTRVVEVHRFEDTQ